jgi:hypothetical protein
MYASPVCLLPFIFLLANGTPISTLAESIEFCYIADYLGDVNAPNNLSLRLLQNIQDLVGQPPIIRIGGHTQDVAQYSSTCALTLTALYSDGNTEAYSVTFNKNLYSVLNNNVPSNQQFIFGLNLGQDSVAYPLAEVQRQNRTCIARAF